MTYLLRKDKNTFETLGGRLKQLREARHLKQEQVALLLNTTRSTICTYENDVRQPPYDMLIKLADFYHVSTDFLLGCQRADPDLVDLGRLSQRDAGIIRHLIYMMEEEQDGEAYKDRPQKKSRQYRISKIENNGTAD